MISFLYDGAWNRLIRRHVAAPPAKSLTVLPLIPYKPGMPASIRLPSTGASCRLTAMLAGLGAGFSMGLILCLCGGLIPCFAVLSAQMRQPAQAVLIPPAMTPDEIFNARYYPLFDCPRFGKPKLENQMKLAYTNWLRYMGPLPYLEPLPEDLPTEDPSPKTPLYPVSFPATSLGAAPAADAAPAPRAEE